MARTIHIEESHLTILRRAVIEGDTLRITEQLDRKVYITINKVLEALDGKWDKKAKAHLFPGDIMGQIKALLDGGTVAVEKKATEQQTLQQFYTPTAMARRIIDVVDALEIGLRGKRVLEPSCGEGALVRPLVGMHALVTAIDINPEVTAVVSGLAEHVHTGDFLSFDPPTEKFDLCVMNSPFTKGQDAKHALHALNWVHYGASVYAVMPPMWRNKSTGPYKALNEKTSDLILSFDAGTFEDTNIATELVRFTNA